MTAERLARPEELVVCPIDDWPFAPRYTDGVCPLCGWRPEGVHMDPPLFTRIDWFWPSMGVLLVVSVLMAVLVLTAYNRA
jgi:hypothetical protein